MDQMQKPSRRLIWVGIIGVVAIIAIIVTILFALVNSGAKKDVVTTPVQSDETVATKEEAKQNISSLEASVKQAAADQAAAKAALKDSEKQVKVGN